MSHNHNHSHHHDHSSLKGGRLFITVFLNVFITVAQVIGGLLSGSVALLSDAMHNFSDVLSLIISYIAAKISGRKYTPGKTYGFKRAEIFAAFLNSATLIIIAVFITVEAVEHLLNPEVIAGNTVIYLAGLSILLNGLSVLLIKDGAKDSMNIKSAYLHLFSDMLTSIAVLMSGLMAKYFQVYWLDGIISIGIAIYLLYHSKGIFLTSLKVLMQFTPEAVDIKKIADQVVELKGVKNIHHVHVWQLDEKEFIFDAHIDTEEDVTISEFEKIKSSINDVLQGFGIHHVTLQPEFAVMDDKHLIVSE